MKKIIALLLAVVMVLGLVACSSSADKTPDTTPAETTDNTPADTTDTETKTDDTAADDTAAAASGKVYCRSSLPTTPPRQASPSRSSLPLPAPTPTP